MIFWDRSPKCVNCCLRFISQIASTCNCFDCILPVFAVAPAVRKIIYTTNASESRNRIRQENSPPDCFLIFLIQENHQTQGSFPTAAAAATKMIYLAICNFEKASRCVREWGAARNQFAILYPERFNK